MEQEQNVPSLKRLENAAFAVGANMVESRKAKNVMKGAFIEARVSLNVPDKVAYTALVAALEKGAKSVNRKATLTESELTLIRVDVHQARKVVQLWDYVPASQHKRIFAGEIAISGVASKAQAAKDQATRNAEEEAATNKANSASKVADIKPHSLGPVDAEQDNSPKGADGKPRKARDSKPEGSAIAQAMRDLATYLGNGPQLTEEESEAFLALQAAMDAFAAQTVPAQKVA